MPLMPPENETEAHFSRITREGKRISYKLSVMQQPERARACGAGAKCMPLPLGYMERKGRLTETASADRRPVDPPPVVELRIFESDPNDDLHKTDITFAYNASFFLYATLQTARPIAHGRVAGAPTTPVLTGVPVAGIAYLDRPSQAGYFIFPDLSVRHEGRYRLTFHLYEETKDLKDADRDPPIPDTTVQPLKPGASTNDAFNFRLLVNSVPFTVYSAKKFPGLATSTSLSRIIAEQGCRVRIRRDVRMRRRTDKRNDDYDEYSAAPRQADNRYSTPDAYTVAAAAAAAAATPIERPRSASTSTIEPALPYAPDAQRRPSGSDYGYPCAQPYQRAIPVAPQASPYPSHLSFGSGQPQYHAPPLPPTPQATAPVIPYSPHLSYSHTRNPSTEYEPTGYPYPQPRPPTERTSSYPGPLPPLRPLEPPKGFTQPAGEPRSSDPNAYHQSQALPPAPRSHTPSTGIAPSLPPLSALSSGSEYAHHMPSSMVLNPSHEMTPGKRLYDAPGPKLSKRSHDESFGPDDRPMQNGMRPDTELYPSMQRKLSEASRAYFGDTRDEMAYKRANGRMAMKIPPTFSS